MTAFHLDARRNVELELENHFMSPHTKYIFLSLDFLREDFSQGIIYLRKQKEFRNLNCVSTYWNISICISCSVTFGSNVNF